MCSRCFSNNKTPIKNCKFSAIESRICIFFSAAHLLYGLSDPLIFRRKTFLKAGFSECNKRDTKHFPQFDVSFQGEGRCQPAKANAAAIAERCPIRRSISRGQRDLQNVRRRQIRLGANRNYRCVSRYGRATAERVSASRYNPFQHGAERSVLITLLVVSSIDSPLRSRVSRGSVTDDKKSRKNESKRWPEGKERQGEGEGEREREMEQRVIDRC